jgi:SAM-dependent methyltransferase
VIEGLKRVVGSIYSAAAERFYEPVVVKGTFRLLGGRHGKLHELVLDQGRRAVTIAAGRPILDMPVGTAFFTIPTARAHDGIVVGADIAEGMVKQAQRVARDGGVDNVLVVRADAHRLPFADETFGAVLCSNGLQVIPGLQPTLMELKRVLAADASLLASVVGIPLSRLLPVEAAARLPAILRGDRDLLRAVADAGLPIGHATTSRLATFIEARRST